MFLLGIFANERTKHSQNLLGGDQYALRRADVILGLLADHPADSFAAFSAVYRGLVMLVDLRRGASARRNGVVHFARIEAPTHADDHETDLQLVAIDCQLPCNSHAPDFPPQGRVPVGGRPALILRSPPCGRLEGRGRHPPPVIPAAAKRRAGTHCESTTASRWIPDSATRFRDDRRWTQPDSAESSTQIGGWSSPKSPLHNGKPTPSWWIRGHAPSPTSRRMLKHPCT